MRPHVIRIAPQKAAEILGPWAVHSGIDDDMADAAGAEILRLGREAEECVYFALLE
jgi:hypothetical protein